MFGESDSESPRAPSPWDSLVLLSSFPKHNGIPKLVPEADEGNIEYKLQLLSPTPARFARLVTQLKWRLLEGRGRAYYELGVSDSGMLVGLPPEQLEESLETLDMMASEIGASVTVVKEIKVPPELSGLAESESHIVRWDGRRSTRRKELLRAMECDGSPATSATELDTELSNADDTDMEVITPSSPATSLASVGGELNLAQPKASLGQPPFDPALAMSTPDLGGNDTHYVSNEAEAPDGDDPANVVEFSGSLEISSVYRPRPMRKRVTDITSPPAAHFEYVKKRLKNGYLPSQSTNIGDTIAHGPNETYPQQQGAKTQFCEDKRDKSKISPLLTHTPTYSAESPASSVDRLTLSSCTQDELNASALGSPQITITNSSTSDCMSGITTTTDVSKEPWLIVEVLVLWALSLDEAFLDFESFLQ